MSAGVVIIGGGQAGVEAASALRALGYAEPVSLISDEPEPPYQRPPLSKEYLLGKIDAARLPLRAESFYTKHRIDLLLSQRVVDIGVAMKRVKLASGAVIPYDFAILATGARNRILTGSGAGRVLYLRTKSDSDAVRQRLAEVESVAVIGGGFIGLEVAAAARSLGKRVIVLEAAPRLMSRAASPLISDFFRDMHRAEGVEVLLGAAISEIERDAVRLADGTSVPAQAIFAGIGVTPNVEQARDAELAVDGGISVDACLRTSDPNIFAIGDCAEFPNPFLDGGASARIRLESVQNAVDQARYVARCIANGGGSPEPFSEIPWFWTDQFDVRFQMAGLCARHDQIVVRGATESRKFSAFYFRQGRLVSADSVNRFGDHIAVRKILRARASLTQEQAADESFDLKQLVG
ncbi:MAG TPA: FAD-dependent oxidoreductase [Rhizomicrobium sp.]|jgi:3-phenylpropionate/trans-cinnamate dioxygenase ferredoxin reductase subunit|nr:FAD-dependent oxidoreductase [Rhizomicrobium sp.]